MRAILIWLLLAGSASADITSNLLVHLPCQDNAASTVVENNGSVGGDAVLGGGDNTADKDVAGPGGTLASALQMNGSDDFITLDSGPTVSGDMTIAVWMNAASWFVGNLFYSADATDGMRFSSTTSTRFRISGTNRNSTMADSFTLSNDTWYHIAVVRSGTGASWYVDGVLRASSVSVNGDFTCERLARDGATYSAVSYADARIYERALSTDDIAELIALADEEEGGGKGLHFYYQFSRLEHDPLSVYQRRQRPLLPIDSYFAIAP